MLATFIFWVFQSHIRTNNYYTDAKATLTENSPQTDEYSNLFKIK